MEMTQLKCFLAVARERSFTRAAKARHMTQPSLSYQIARLEEELGAALFLRKPKAVELSEAGRQLLESAARIVEEEERALQGFRRRESLQEGGVRFGVIPTMAPYLLPALLGRFRASFPALGIVARESRTSQLVREVVEEELEFAIVSDVDEALLKKYSLSLQLLLRERLLLAVPLGHALSISGKTAPRELDEREVIMLSEGNCLREQSLRLCRPREGASSLVCEQLPTQLSMVGAGLGIAVVPEMAVKQSIPAGVAFVRFAEPQPTRMIGLLKKRGRKLGAAAQELADRLRSGASGG